MKQKATIPSSLLTPKEVAGFLNVSADWVLHLARQNKLPCVRLGRRTVRFRSPDVLAFSLGRK